MPRQKLLRSLSIFTYMCFMFLSLSALAQERPAGGSLKSAEVIGAKAALEDMLVRRYSQELSSIISHENFSMGARLDLTINEALVGANNKNANSDLYTELDLGYLDADTLFASYANFGSSNLKNPLEKFSVSKIEFMVGLVPDMGDGIKQIVSEWLQARVQEEFGTIGKSQVQFIQDADSAEEILNQPDGAKPESGVASLASKSSAKSKKQKSFMEKLKEMQSLAGNLVLAFAILMGIFLWRILMGNGASSQSAEGPSTEINIENKTENGGATQGSEAVAQTTSKDEVALYVEKNAHLTSQIKELAPKVTSDLQNLVTQWCERGENGYLQLACFAEISGSVLGTLPIPKEHREQMGEIFAKMHDMSDQEKHNVMSKTYWDMVAVVNLGSETLHRPFSFVGSSSFSTVSKVLLQNSADIQAVVSTYMPDVMRKSYFDKLDAEAKLDVLKTAAQMDSISKNNLQQIEKDIAPYFETKMDESAVSMSSAFDKIVSVMSILDACQTLPQITGVVVENYKRTHAHIAFIGQWQGTSAEILFRRANNQEITALVRVIPEIMDKVLASLSPLAKKVVSDDLSQPDTMSVAEKEKQLALLNKKLENLVKRGEVILEDVLPKAQAEDSEGQVAA